MSDCLGHHVHTACRQHQKYEGADHHEHPSGKSAPASHSTAVAPDRHQGQDERYRCERMHRSDEPRRRPEISVAVDPAAGRRPAGQRGGEDDQCPDGTHDVGDWKPAPLRSGITRVGHLSSSAHQARTSPEGCPLPTPETGGPWGDGMWGSRPPAAGRLNVAGPERGPKRSGGPQRPTCTGQDPTRLTRPGASASARGTVRGGRRTRRS